MGIILRGVFYDSPCVFCKSVFSKIANKCEIYNTKDYYSKICSPRVFFASHIMNIEAEEAPDDEYQLFQLIESQKMEV